MIYWRSIDGLRTVAVLAVLLFHLQPSLLPGGFVGVDIFFVISGFLITHNILSDIKQGQFTILRFYQRRIARIFPAALLVIVATTSVGYFIYSAQDMASLGANAAAAAVSLINVKLLFQGNYFELSSDSQPLLHYWSLAVEEQFYLVYPAFLYLLVRKSQNPLMLTGGAAVLSFALCVLLTAKNQPMAFYMLPTRAWELLCGAMLAMHRARGGNFPVRMATAMGWCGAALIVVVIVLFSETPSFPGWLAALPVAGTVLLIASSNAESAPYNRLLSQPLMIAIGLRSYSLYLWHWPVYSFVDYALYQEAAGLRLGLKIVLTVVLSMLSYRFVEQPARVYLNRPRRKWIAFLGAGALIAAIVIGGSWLRSTLYYNVPPGSVAAGGLTVNGGQRAVVVLSGDSEAAMYGVTMAEIARRQGFTLYALGTAGHNQLPQEESTSWPAVVELARAKRPDIVVIVNLWTKLKNDPARIRQAIAEITPYCKRILIIAQQPRPPETASREAIRGGAKPPFVESSADRQAREVNTVLLKGLQNERVTVIDPAYLFIAPDGALRIFGDDWRMIYYDQVHLSDTGTRMTQNLLTQTLLGLIER